jgi:hypothetical protein
MPRTRTRQATVRRALKLGSMDPLSTVFAAPKPVEVAMQKRAGDGNSVLTFP